MIQMFQKEVWLHIDFGEVKNKVRAREILPERFVLLESSLINLNYDLIPKGTIMQAKRIDDANHIASDGFWDIIEDPKEYTYVYEILTSTIPYIFDFEKMIAPALKKHHFSYEIKHDKYLLIHTLEENYPTINPIFEKLNYFPKEIDMYDFGAKKYDSQESTIWTNLEQTISKYGKWVFLPVFSFIILGKFIYDTSSAFSISKILDTLFLGFEISIFSTLGVFLLIEGGILLNQLFEKKYTSPTYLAKIAKNKRLKAFANKHKFLFFKDRWKGCYKGFVVEIRIDYNIETYQTVYDIQASVAENLYYDLDKLPKEYHFYHNLNHICIYKYEPFWFMYPNLTEIEKHLDEMILQIKKSQVKI